MAKTKNTLVHEAFTNEIGQTINPGDRVAYVSHGYSVHQNTGYFDGVYKNKQGNIVFTRISGIHTTKMVDNGRTSEYTYGGKVHTYKVYDKVECAPHGSTVLQRHRIFKI